MKNHLNLLFKLLFLLCILKAYETEAQPLQLWTARYNGADDSIDVASAICVDNSGNSYVTGYSNDLLSLLTNIVTIKYDPDGNQVWRESYGSLLFADQGNAIKLDNSQQFVYVAGFTNAALNLLAADYVIIKYDVLTGNQIWARTYNFGLLGDDKATAITIDTQNNPIITGYSQGFLLFLTPYDYATVKYDPNGNQVWAARYNGTGNSIDRAFSIAADNSNNVIVTGESIGNGSDYDYATVKYNSSGTQQWAARYNGTGGSEDRAYALVVDNAGNVIVTGESRGSTSNFDYATVKYNSGGSQQWASRYNGPGNSEDRAYALVVDNSGSPVVIGSSRSAPTPGSEDYATVKYNPNGSQVWASRYNGTGNNEDRAYALVVDNSNNVYVTGESRSAASSFDYATLKYDPSGNQLWNALIYNGTGNNEDRAYALVVDNTGNIYVTGSSRNGSLLGSEDYLTVKYGDSLNGITLISQQVPLKFGITQNYPNPFNPTTYVTIDIPSKSFVRFEIFDILGVRKELLINSGLNAGSYKVEWDASNYPSGVYFYKITTTDLSITKKMILLK